MASGLWVASQGPLGGGLYLRWSSGPLEHGLGVPEGHRLAEWRSCMSVYPWLERLGGHGWAEWRSCVCVYVCVWVTLAWQALGAQSCRVNIVQCCAGFGGVACKAEIMQGWGVQPSERSSCRAVHAFGAWPAKQRSCRAGEHGPERWSSFRAV
jgi:hypothetical protein